MDRKITWFLSPLVAKGEVKGTSTRVPCSLPCLISTTREGRSYRYREVPVATRARKRRLPKTTLTIIIPADFSERKGQVVKSARMHFSSCLLLVVVHLLTRVETKLSCFQVQ